ncbi:MAG TPA: dephospho-CoA kinase [Candidatus Dormibacteraeota bacterium]|nr:dephospho-CoA kinase [Candidatus Dormibacteraeota bacterium]
MALIIGLTGGISSGKSTVSTMFSTLHIPVIDADKVSREVVEPGKSAYHEIRRVFGQEIFKEDQTLNRKKLGAIIFADEEKRKQLNAIVHPAVRKEMLQQRDHYVEQGEKCVVLDIPLLFEGNLTSMVDKTIVVAVGEDVQLQRLMARDQLTIMEAKQRIKSQMPIREKVDLADAVINNNGSKIDSEKQLMMILKEWNIL